MCIAQPSSHTAVRVQSPCRRVPLSLLLSRLLKGPVQGGIITARVPEEVPIGSTLFCSSDLGTDVVFETHPPRDLAVEGLEIRTERGCHTFFSSGERFGDDQIGVVLVALFAVVGGV